MLLRARLLVGAFFAGFMGLVVAVHSARRPLSSVSGFPLVHENETHVPVDLETPCGFWANYPGGRDLICGNGVRLPFTEKRICIVLSGPSFYIPPGKIPWDRYPVVLVVDPCVYRITEVISVRDGLLLSVAETIITPASTEESTAGPTPLGESSSPAGQARSVRAPRAQSGHWPSRRTLP